MQTYEEILTTATDELMQTTLTKLERATPSLDAKQRRISTLNDEILRDSALPESLKQKISEYISLSMDVQMQQFRCLYRQGAKDGMQLLQKLNII